MARLTRSGLLSSFRDLTSEGAQRVLEAADVIRRSNNMIVVERKMADIDRLIEGHGVEAIFFLKGEGMRNYSSGDDELLSLYVNTGDTYTPTVLWDARKDRVVLTTFGDFVERLPRRYDDPRS